MSQIYKFREITDYIRALNFNIENKFSDFLIYHYEKINWDQINRLSKYRHEYFEITLDVTKGCDFSVDQFELPYVTNRLTLISPDRLQTIKTYSEIKEPSKGYGILFKPEFIQADSANGSFLKDFPFFNHLNSPSVTLEENDVDLFINIIRNIKHEHDSGSTLSTQIIRHYLNVLFLKAKQNYPHIANKAKIVSREQEIYDEFKWLVHMHSLELKSVQAYADKMHITSKYLSETIKKVSGESALEFIHKTKLRHAKALLCQTSKTVSEIAYELNFENPEYFSVFFKRLSGKSPSKYRDS